MLNPQNTANRIKTLAKSKKYPISKLLQDCELNKNIISTMQNNGYYPRIEALVKIADYLNCPLDYLLGRGLFENWEFIFAHKDQIISELERVYPFLKEYSLSTLPETSLMHLLPAFIQKVVFDNNQIHIYFS